MVPAPKSLSKEPRLGLSPLHAQLWLCGCWSVPKHPLPRSVPAPACVLAVTGVLGLPRQPFLLLGPAFFPLGAELLAVLPRARQPSCPVPVPTGLLAMQAGLP